MTWNRKDGDIIIEAVQHAVKVRRDVKEIQASLQRSLQDAADSAGFPVKYLNKLIAIAEGRELILPAEIAMLVSSKTENGEGQD